MFSSYLTVNTLSYQYLKETVNVCGTIFPVYCTDYMEHVTTFCGGNIEFWLLHVVILTGLQALNHFTVKCSVYNDVSVFREVCKIVKKRLLASSSLSVCPSNCSSFCLCVRPHGTARPPLDGFPGNLIFDYRSKICCGNSSSDWNLARMTRNLHENLHTFVIVFWVNSSWSCKCLEKSCRGNQNVHFVFSNFGKSRRLWNSVEKNIVEPDRPRITIWRMCIACWIPKATNTYSEYVILIAVPLQEWLHKRYMYFACLVYFHSVVQSFAVHALSVITYELLCSFSQNSEGLYAHFSFYNFHPYRALNVESMDSSSSTPQSKVW